MSEVGSAFVSVMPSMQGFGKAVVSEATIAGDVAGTAAGSRFGRGFLKTSIGPLREYGKIAAGLFVLDKIKNFAAESVGLARQEEKLAAGIQQVIKTTGDASNVSAEHVQQLAESLSSQTGASDIAIKSGEQLLLTFTNISNQAGANNDIFDRAVSITNDLSAAYGVNMTNAARVVGRALNDPVKGTALLTRYGIQLDDQTKKTITSLVAQGNTLGAQKVVLGELTKRFGGLAAASETMGEKVHQQTEKLKEDLGAVLLPAINAVERAFLGTVSGVSTAVGWLEKHKTADMAVAGALTGALLPALGRTAAAMGSKVWYEFSFLMLRAKTAVAELTATEAAAAVETTLFSRVTAGAGAILGLASVRYGIAGAAIAANYYLMKKASDAAKGSADDFVNSLHVNTTSLTSLQQGMRDIRAEMASVVAGSNTQKTAITDELGKAYQDLATKAQTLTATQHTLSTALHMSGPEVAALAAKYNIDLTQGVGKALPALEAVRRSIFLSHHPAQAAAADLANLGNKANTLSDDLSILDTRWNNLVGNFVGMKVAEAQARDSIVALSQALGKSKSGFDLNTKAGRAAVEQLGSTSDSLNAVAQSVFKQTGSYTKTEAVMKRMVARMTADLPKGSAIAKKVTAEIARYMAGLANKAKGEGSRTGASYADGLANALHDKLGIVKARAAALANAIDATVRAVHITSSPSKLAEQTGWFYGEGLAAGLDKSQASVADAGRRLADVAANATAAELKKRVTDLQSQLSGLRGDKSGFASSITSGLSSFDVSSFTDADSLVAALNKRDRQTHRERKLAGSLLKAGLPPALLAEIEQEDPSAAIKLMQSILGTDKTTFANIGGAFGSINQTAGRAGHEQAREVYDPQIKELIGEIRALRRALPHDLAGALNDATGNAKRKGQARAST